MTARLAQSCAGHARPQTWRRGGVRAHTGVRRQGGSVMAHGAATLRQQIIALLRGRLWEAGELSRALGISQRQVESHLTHVRQSAGALSSSSSAPWPWTCLPTSRRTCHGVAGRPCCSALSGLERYQPGRERRWDPVPPQSSAFTLDRAWRLPGLITNGVSLLQTKISDREGYEARRVGE